MYKVYKSLNQYDCTNCTSKLLSQRSASQEKSLFLFKPSRLNDIIDSHKVSGDAGDDVADLDAVDESILVLGCNSPSVDVEALFA